MAVTVEGLDAMIAECIALVEQTRFKELFSKLVVLLNNLPSIALQAEANDIVAMLAREAQKDSPDTEGLIIVLSKLREDLHAEVKRGAALVELDERLLTAEEYIRAMRFLAARAVLSEVQNALPSLLRGSARDVIARLDKEAERATPDVAAVLHVLELLRGRLRQELNIVARAAKPADTL